MTQTSPEVSLLSASVAEEVRALVARRRTRQTQLALVLGVSQAQVSARLNGRVSFTLDEIGMLAEFFGVAPGSLLGGVSPTPGYPVNDPDGDDYAVVLPFRRPAARTIPWMPPAPPRPHPRPYVVALEAVAS